MYYTVQQQRTQKTLLGYTFILHRISIFHVGSTLIYIVNFEHGPPLGPIFGDSKSLF